MDTARTFLPAEETANGNGRDPEPNTNEPTDTGNQNGQPRRRGTRTEQDINCPICLSEAAFAVETNCAHKFCGNYTNTCNWYLCNSTKFVYMDKYR